MLPLATRRSPHPRLRGVVFALALAHFSIAGWGADAITQGIGAKGVRIPLFGDDKSVPAATVCLDLLSVESDKRGFFRVALFPLVVGQNVEFRFRTVNPSALGDFEPAFKTLTRMEKIELRDCKFFTPRSTEPLLSARLARIVGEAEWQLEEVTLASGEYFPKARLSVRGQRAGLLTTTGEGAHQKISLFPTP